jgi:intein/homing endonuclease
MTTHLVKSLGEREQNLFGNGFFSAQDNTKRIVIKDIPIMVAEDGRYICFPEERMENFKVGIFGETGCIRKGTELLVKEEKSQKLIKIKIEELGEIIKKKKVLIQSMGTKINHNDYKYGKLSWNQIESFVEKGKRKIQRVWLSGDLYVDATEDHHFLAIDHSGKIIDKELSTFKVGDLVPIRKKFNFKNDLKEVYIHEKGKEIHSCFGSETKGYYQKKNQKFQLTSDLGYLSGLYLAEGSINGSVVISSMDGKILDKLKRIVEKNNWKWYDTKSGIGITHCGILNYFLLHKFGTGSGNKFISEDLFDCSDDFCYAFLSGYLDGDGSINQSKNKLDFSFTTKSQQLRDDLIMMFNKVGISVIPSKRKVKNYGIYYLGNICTNDIMKDKEKFGFIQKESKRNLIYNLKQKQSEYYNFIPIPKGLILSSSFKHGTKGEILIQTLMAYKRRGCCSKSAFGKLIEDFKEEEYKALNLISWLKKQDNDISWYKIKKIEDIGEDFVYDIGVNRNHNFCLYNGIIVKNSGKTMMLHTIIDRLRWYQGLPCAILNDNQFETTSWAMRNEVFLRGSIKIPPKELRVLNEVAYPLPIVHVYPQNNETEIYSTTVPHLRMSVPFQRIIENYEAYLKMKSSTAKYFLKIFSDNQEWKEPDFTWDRVEGIIDDGIADMTKSKGKSQMIDQTLEATKQSMLASLNEVKAEKYCNVVAREQRFENTGTPSTQLMIKKDNKVIDEGPVFSMLMKYGFVPTLITTDLLHKRYAEPYVADLIDEIFNFPKIYGQNCLAIIPEMKLFMKYKTVKDKIENITGRGRMRGVKLIYDTHNYKKIADDIIDNTVFAFAFTQKSETAKKMKRDFDLSAQDETRIINLKQFECLAIASAGEYWIAYDDEGHREKVKGCIKGMALPTLSRHSKPILDKEKEKDE